MDQIWISEERKLWNLIDRRPAMTQDSKRGRREIARLKARARARGVKFEMPKDLLTEAQIRSKSWAAYNTWIKH